MKKEVETYLVRQRMIRSIGRCYIVLDTGRRLKVSKTMAGSESGAIGRYDIKEYHKVMDILDNNY